MTGKAIESSPTLVNLEELAELIGISKVTMAALLRQHNDFPVEKRGTNGVAYEFDARKVRDFMAAIDEADQTAAEARADELREMRLDLFPQMADAEATTGLTPAERKAEAEATDKWDLIALRRGQLVRVDDVENTLRAAFSAFRDKLANLDQRLARKFDLDRPTRLGLRDELDQALAGVAAVMRRQDQSDDIAA